jgi:hypothetical protein
MLLLLVAADGTSLSVLFFCFHFHFAKETTTPQQQQQQQQQRRARETAKKKANEQGRRRVSYIHLTVAPQPKDKGTKRERFAKSCQQARTIPLVAESHLVGSVICGYT